MTCITKTLFRTAVIGGLALGGLTILVGPQRVVGGFAQVQHTVISWFDGNMEDPVLLRQQLKRLQQEYPDRLRKITRSLAEVEGQIKQVEYYKAVSSNAVTIAKNDLATLKGLVSTAQAQFAAYDGSTPRAILIRFQGSNITINQAYERAQRIKSSAMNNQDKASHFDRELEVLNTYRGRLVQQKDKLTKEYSSFQNQLWTIQRQIDQIERNEDLIALMKDCNSGLAENDKFKIRNLDQLSNRLTAVQKENDAVLDSLSQQATTDSYEDQAKDAMRSGQSMQDVFTWDEPTTKADPSSFQTPLIIDQNTVKQQKQEAEDNQVIARATVGNRN